MAPIRGTIHRLETRDYVMSAAEVVMAYLRADFRLTQDAAPSNHDTDELSDNEVIATMALYEPSRKTLDALRNVAHVASAHCNGQADHMAIRYALAALQGHKPSLTAALDDLYGRKKAEPTPLPLTGELLWRVATAARDYVHGRAANTSVILAALDDLHGETPGPAPLPPCETDAGWRAARRTMSFSADNSAEVEAAKAQNIKDKADAFIRDEGRGNMRTAQLVALVRMRAAQENVFHECEKYDRLVALGEAVEAMPHGASLRRLRGEKWGYWPNADDPVGWTADSPAQALGLATKDAEKGDLTSKQNSLQ